MNRTYVMKEYHAYNKISSTRRKRREDARSAQRITLRALRASSLLFLRVEKFFTASILHLKTYE
jgi:hypothetical protein